MTYKVIIPDYANRRIETPEGSAVIINKLKESRFQINEYILKTGKSVYFNPPSSPGSIKSYYIISGLLESLDHSSVCNEGTIIVLKDTDEVFQVNAIVETRVLVHSLDENSFENTEERFRYMYNLLVSLQNKDSYTLNHSENVKSLVEKMATFLGYKGNRYMNTVHAGRYHDIGKIYIPDEILNKSSVLDFEEYEIMKTHVSLGHDLILQFYGEETYNIARQHHERIDGSGYPLGLKGDEISEEARVLAICDSYDAMTSNRVYKSGKTKEEALQELRDLKGIKYDSDLVDIFIELMEE